MSTEEKKPARETPAPLPSGEVGKFTMFPHPILRHWLAILSGDAFKAFCYIIDRTWGWNKQEEYISLADFKHALGIPSKHDEKVYRALRELFVFGVIGEGSRGKRQDRSYFVTLAALDTTNMVLEVKDGRPHITTNRGLVDLLTLREEIHSHHVSSGPNTALVDLNRLFARQAAQQEARAKAKQRAKDTSLKTSFKHKYKDEAASPPAIDVKNEKGKEEKKTKKTDYPPSQPSENPMRSKSTEPTTEELAARRLADKLAREQQEVRDKANVEQEAEDRTVSRLQHEYDETVRAKNQAAQGSSEWEAARQRLNEIKRQLAEHGWYL
ncbi:MAG TPA: hypothetical protein VKT82_08450 [Ktedonobacterales bacterium]|nr:hypothetical protein [Ktedonobacterales bacterium]